MTDAALVFTPAAVTPPGLNAVIRAVVKSAIPNYNWKVIGIRDGFAGRSGPGAPTNSHCKTVAASCPEVTLATGFG